MSSADVDFIALRNEVAAFLKANLSSGNLVSTSFAIAKGTRPEITKCITLVTYKGFTNKPKDSVGRCFDRDGNFIFLESMTSIARNADQVLGRLYTTGAEITNLLRSPTLYGSPPFGNRRVSNIIVREGKIDSDTEGTGEPAWFTVLEVMTLTT